MKRVKYFTRPDGFGICLWKLQTNGRVRQYGAYTKEWSSSIVKKHNLTDKGAGVIQVSRDQARKWYPAAFRKTFGVRKA